MRVTRKTRKLLADIKKMCTGRIHQQGDMSVPVRRNNRMYEGLVNNLRKDADEWENKHPFIAFGELRVHDALRDAARALKEADDTLERVTLERDAAVEAIKQHRSCIDCKHSTIIPDGKWIWTDCPKRDGRCHDHDLWEWRGVKEE